MEDIGFILASYIAAFGSTLVLALWVVRKGRALAAQVPDEDKPWI